MSSRSNTGRNACAHATEGSSRCAAAAVEVHIFMNLLQSEGCRSRAAISGRGYFIRALEWPGIYLGHGDSGTDDDSPAPPESRGDRLGGERARADAAARGALVRGQRRGSARAHRADAARRRADSAQPGKLSRLRAVPLGAERRGARRAPHLHLHTLAGGRRSQQSLDGPAAGTREDARAVSRLHARTHPVRRSLLHGTAGFGTVTLRCRDHRQPLRRAQHADHDARRPRGARAHRTR